MRATSPRRPDILVPLSLFAITVASRLPFLGPGYGLDTDSSLVMFAARHLVQTGELLPSRFPGYPLFEGAYALLWRFGIRDAFACSLATALVSGAAAVVFYRLCAEFIPRLHAAGLALVFVFTPGVHAASCEVIDFLWTTTFVLAGFHQASRGRFAMAGLLLGISGGIRLTSIGFLLPFGVLAWLRSEPSERIRAIATLMGIAVAVTTLCFLPTLLRYGVKLLPKPEPLVDLLPGSALMAHARFLLFAVRLWEPVGFLALLVGSGLVVRRFGGVESNARPVFYAAIAGIVVFGVVFALRPYKPGYLVPIVPLFLLAFGVALGPRSLAILGVLMVASTAITYSPSRGSWEPGGVFYAHSRRASDFQGVRDTLTAAESVEDGTVVLTMHYQPAIEWQLLSPGDLWLAHRESQYVDGRIRFRNYTDAAEVERLIDEGTRVFFVPRIRDLFPQTTWERDGRTYRMEPLLD